MKLKKVDSIDYDKKDCDLIICPVCKSSNFALFQMTQKVDLHRHVHIRCIFCDITFCPELSEIEVAKV